MLVIVISIVATFYFFGDPQKLTETIISKLKQTPLAPVAEKLEGIDIQQISQGIQESVKNAESEVTQVSKKTVEVGQHAENVLGSSVTAPSSENTTPIHEKAFEYGKYIYCKQVVDDYETLNPSLKEE
jgi:hypothetical protein